MKIVVFLGIVWLLCSCQSRTEQLKAQLIPVIDSEIIRLGATKIDSIKVIKIDTISDSLYYLLRSNGLYHSIPNFIKESKYYSIRFKTLTNQAQEAYDAAHMQLYTPDQDQFRQEQMDTYKQRLDEAQGLKDELVKYDDTLQKVYDEIKRIERITTTKKLKRDNFLGYFVTCRLLATDKTNSEIKLDNLGFCISPNFRIMHIDKM